MPVKRSEQLVVEFPPAAYTLEGERWVPTGGASDLGSYETISLGANFTGFFLESTIDLGGFFIEEDTVLIPEMYVIQDPGFYQAVQVANDYTGSRGLLYVMEIVSTRRLNMNTVFTDLFVSQTTPGMPLSIYDKQQVVVGEVRAMMPNLPQFDPNILAPINSPGISVMNRASSFGYTEGIANQTLFCYRCLLPYLQDPGDAFVAPSLRIRMQVAVDQVSSPEYIFTLKRNVELDQS